MNEADKDKRSLWTSKLTNLNTDFYAAIHLMDDDVAEYVYNPDESASSLRQKFSQYHYWQADPNRDAELKEFDDGNWSSTYARIAVINTVLAAVDDFRDTPQNILTCDRVKGEALFLRAQNYFWLANKVIQL